MGYKRCDFLFESVNITVTLFIGVYFVFCGIIITYFNKCIEWTISKLLVTACYEMYKSKLWSLFIRKVRMDECNKSFSIIIGIYHIKDKLKVRLAFDRTVKAQ